MSGTTRAFTWDTSGGLPLLLRDGGDAYVYGPDGTPFERIAADGTVVYLHTDQLGSVRALTDGAGAVMGTFAWDAYGNPTGSTGSLSLPVASRTTEVSVSATETPQAFREAIRLHRRPALPTVGTCR